MNQPVYPAVSLILSDIAGLKNTIAYCETRILRLQLALSELATCADSHPSPEPVPCHPEPNPVEESPPARIPIVPTGSPKTIGQAILRIAQDGHPSFSFRELIVCLTEQFPEIGAQCRKRSVYQAVKRLRKRGLLAKTTTGYKRI